MPLAAMPTGPGITIATCVAIVDGVIGCRHREHLMHVAKRHVCRPVAARTVDRSLIPGVKVVPSF